MEQAISSLTCAMELLTASRLSRSLSSIGACSPHQRVVMTPSVAISIVALALSLFSVSWQVARARWERPVVVVSGVALARSVRGIETPVRRIDATNVGERPVTVIAAGWILHAGKDGQGSGWSGVPDDGFPLRLEPYETKSWAIPGGAMATVGPRNLGLPFVRVVRRPTWWGKRRGLPAERTIVGHLGAYFAPAVPKQLHRQKATTRRGATT